MLAEGEILDCPRVGPSADEGAVWKAAGEFGRIVWVDVLSVDGSGNRKVGREPAQKDVQAYEGRNPNSVLVDLGAMYGPVLEKARDQNETAKMWLERNLKNAIENNWF